jgi:Na+/H+ antiporter NhaB
MQQPQPASMLYIHQLQVWAIYFLQWAQRYLDLLDVLAALPSKVQFPLPVLHRSSHSAACQEENDATFTKRAGRQYHELNETLRSYLGPLGISTQVQLTVWPVMTQIKLASCFCQPTNGLSS